MSWVLDAIVGNVLAPIFGYLFGSIGRQIGYVVKYKKNIQNLEKVVNDLKPVRETVQANVDIAKADGMTIKKEAEKWLEEMTAMEEVNKSLTQDKETIKCLDVRSRYRLGRKGKKMEMDAIKLKENRNEFGDEVAYRTLLNDVWNTSSTSYEVFYSRKSLFEEIMGALRDDKISKIGISGMAGVGKTTMVVEVGEQAKKGPFDEVAMAVFSQNPNLKEIQGKLAVCLNLTLNEETEEKRAGQLCNRLKNGRKILVILDDVWDDQITLKKIGIPTDTDNGMGCKILLTSRRLQVCKQMGFEKNFTIGLLSEVEAWHLFRKTVGDFIEADPEIHFVAKQVCRECDFLPLAICAVGGALSGEREKHVWNDALAQLKDYRGYKIDGVEEKVYSCIKWSYSYLKQEDVQSCFLHCCLFPEDTDILIDDLVYWGVGTKFLESTSRTSMKKARDRTLVIVGILKKSFLLLEGSEENTVKMHDVIRDVAISIASKDQNYNFLVKHGVDVWPDDYKCCTIISLILDSYKVRQLPNQLDCRGLRTLMLRDTNNWSWLQLPNSYFKGMKKLEVLVLRHMTLEPSSLSNLVSLRMLCLSDCYLVNLSFLKELKNLEILRIGYIHEHTEILDNEIPELTHLRVLDLSGCTRSIGLGFFMSFPFRLSGLEEVYILEVEGSASLTVPFIPPQEDVILFVKSLTKYNIQIGSTWSSPSTETKILGLKKIPLMDGLDVWMATAEVLYLFDLEGLKMLHDTDGESFLDLKYLYVRDCHDMGHLLGKPKWSSQTHGPRPLGSFGKLRELTVVSCTSLKYLFSPSTARGLPELQKLYINDCEKLEAIIGGDEEVLDKVIFHRLKKMRLSTLPNLRSICTNTEKTSTTECNVPSTIKEALFNEKVMFPVLEILKILQLDSIKAIWDKQLLLVLQAGESFEHLQNLEVHSCKEIEEMVAFEVGQTKEANDEIVAFPHLENIWFVNLPNLKIFNGSEEEETSDNNKSRLQGLFNHKVRFPSLKDLYIEMCGGLAPSTN